MDRQTATSLIAELISATQSGRLSWQKQSSREIVDKDHTTSAVYFAETYDLGFRVYRYKWERDDYYTWYEPHAFEIEPRRVRGVILELIDSDGALIETIRDISALRDLFDVVNRRVSNIQEKIERFLGNTKVVNEQEMEPAAK